MDYKKFIEGKNVLITGGTGSFGNQIVTKLLTMKPAKIIIFSRDEKKQYDMQNKFEDEDRLEYVIGDVRDLGSISEATCDVDIIYNAAALKHVPVCESYPLEAIKTNILGAENIRLAAIRNNVSTVVSISTDKAVKPINAMGMTKALQEKIILCPSNRSYKTRFICVRYGNVLGSRGSVVPFFMERIRQKKFLPITDPKMTRFLLTLDDAIELVFKATVEAENRQLFVKKMPACTISDLVEVMKREVAKDPNYPTKIVGLRPGEKIHEVLVCEEEMTRAIETDTYFIIPPYDHPGKPKLLQNLFEYTSNVTTRLSGDELVNLLRKTKVVE